MKHAFTDIPGLPRKAAEHRSLQKVAEKVLTTWMSAE